MSINQIIENFIQNGAFIPYSVFRMISNESLKIKEDRMLLGQLPSIFIAGIENNNNDVTWKHFYSCILSASFKENRFLAVYSPSFTTIKDYLSDFIELNKENDVIICFCSSQKENDTNVYIEEEPFSFYKDIKNARTSSGKVTRLLLINDKQQNGYKNGFVDIYSDISNFYKIIQEYKSRIPPRSKAFFLLPGHIETKRSRAELIIEQFRGCGLNLEINHIVQEDDQHTAQMIAVVFWHECTKGHGNDPTAARALQELVRSTSSDGQPYAQTALQCALIPLWLLSAIHANDDEYQNIYCRLFIDNDKITDLKWAEVQKLVGKEWADEALDTIFNYLLTLDDSETEKMASYLDKVINLLGVRFGNNENRIQKETIELLRKIYKDRDKIQKDRDKIHSLLTQKDLEIEKINNKHNSEIKTLSDKIEALNNKHSSEIEALNNKHNREIEALNNKHSSEIEKIKNKKENILNKTSWFYVVVLFSIMFWIFLTYT